MDIDELAGVLKALSDKSRLRMLALLKVDELCVCELTPLLDMSQPAVSQHLRKLKAARLVKERKAGQWVYYSLHESLLEAEPWLSGLLKSLPNLSQEVQKMKGIQSTEVRCGL